MYRAAVIGLGIMGNIADGLGGRHPALCRPCNHADAYEAHARTTLVAGVTRDPQKQALFLEKRGAKAVYADYREMLDKETPDIVSIATPATCHAEMVIAAAEAGVKGIYCEKAMAASLSECDRMIETCQGTGTVLIINHQRRWDDRYGALKRVIDEGQIGRLQAIQISFGGSRLCRSGSHLFDLALMFADDAVASGCGWLSDRENFDPGGVGLFETQGGIRIVVDGSKGMTHPLRADFIGDRGILRVVDDGFQVELWKADETSEFGMMARHHLPMNYPVRSSMLNAIDDLLHCIETGDQPCSGGLQGRAAFEMITAIHLSDRNGRAFLSFPLHERSLRIESN